MAATPGTVRVDTVRRPFTGPYTHLLAIENTGTVPVTVSTSPGHPLDGITVAAGETRQVQPQGWTVHLAADEVTEVAVTKFTLDNLKADAADRWNIPIEFFRGDRSMADIADTVIRYTEFVWGDQ
jgi:hypothetical protein